MKITANFVVDTSTGDRHCMDTGEWRARTPGVWKECSQAGCWHTLPSEPRPGAFSLHNQQPRHIVPCPSRPAAQSVVLSSSAAITDQMNALQGRGHTLLVLLLSAFSFNQPILSEIIRSLCTICCRISWSGECRLTPHS